MAKLKAGSTVGGKKILDESFEIPEVDLTNYATLGYVDTQIGNIDIPELNSEAIHTALGYTPLSLSDATIGATADSVVKRDADGSIYSHRTISLKGPTSANHLTRKDYVDAQVGNVDAIALQGRTPNNFVQVVMHNAYAYSARPAGAISVLWVGSAEPYYAQDNDLWIGG